MTREKYLPIDEEHDEEIPPENWSENETETAHEARHLLAKNFRKYGHEVPKRIQRNLDSQRG